MVRPDRDRPLGPVVRCVGLTGDPCVGLAGGSPVAVSAGAPRSRLRARGETLSPERSIESPRWLVRTGGRGAKPRAQCESVNPAASRDRLPKGGKLAEPLMSRRRRETVPARTAWSRPSRVRRKGRGGHRMGAGHPGVLGRARGESPTRNRRDPTRQPTSGEGGAYKPMAKWHRAGRESEGPIVATKRRTTPWSEGALLLAAPLDGGKCEGMPAMATTR